MLAPRTRALRLCLLFVGLTTLVKSCSVASPTVKPTISFASSTPDISTFDCQSALTLYNMLSNTLVSDACNQLCQKVVGSDTVATGTTLIDHDTWGQTMILTCGPADYDHPSFLEGVLAIDSHAVISGSRSNRTTFLSATCSN